VSNSGVQLDQFPTHEFSVKQFILLYLTYNTDKEIDDIIYKLYDLTEEEQMIIENKL
jgi:hypothetical protein